MCSFFRAYLSRVKCLLHKAFRDCDRKICEKCGRRVPISELVYPEPKNKQVQKVIKAFFEERLLVKGLDVEGREYVEPVHDALITGWTKIKNWLDEKQETFEKVSRGCSQK
ncbi:MAG: hypothetical protein AB4206_17175 [Xenococcaceae cyanobacterium]